VNPRIVKFSTAIIWKTTVTQKGGSFNGTAVGIYNILEK
jgi:hypothetical protein